MTGRRRLLSRSTTPAQEPPHGAAHNRHAELRLNSQLHACRFRFGGGVVVVPAHRNEDDEEGQESARLQQRPSSRFCVSQALATRVCPRC